MKKRWVLPIVILLAVATALGTVYSLYADELHSLFKSVPASVTVRVIKEEGLTITKTSSPNPVDLGGTLTYQLTVKNDSSATSTDVVLTDDLPQGVQFVSATSTAAAIEQDGDTIKFDFGDLLPGESATGIIVVIANSPGAVVNRAFVESRELARRTVTERTEVTGPPSPPSGGGGGAPPGRPVIFFTPEFVLFSAVEGGDNPEPQILSVSTSKSRSVLRFTTESNVDWLEVDPSEGLSDATNDRERITLSVDISDLAAGTYEGAVIISARRASNDPQSVPVSLIISPAPEPGVISLVRAALESNEGVEIITDDGLIQVNIPEGAITDDGEDDDRVVEVEVKSIEIDSVPAPDGGTVFIRAVELNTLVDGTVSPTDYAEPVELVFVLTEADLALAEGDTSRLGVLWFNEETGVWESIEVTYEDDPPPAGRLVALLDHFSLYAVGVMEESEPEEQQVTETETATPTPAPTATSVPTMVPSPTASAIATSTPLPATATAVVVAQAAPMPVPTATPQPTATSVPPAPAVPAAPALPSQPPAEPEAPPVVEETGGIGTATIVILAVVGIAVLAVVAVVGQGLWSRRRQV